MAETEKGGERKVVLNNAFFKWCMGERKEMRPEGVRIRWFYDLEIKGK